MSISNTIYVFWQIYWKSSNETNASDKILQVPPIALQSLA